MKLVRSDEDTVVNETLLELLRTEFDLEVPGFRRSRRTIRASTSTSSSTSSANPSKTARAGRSAP